MLDFHGSNFVCCDGVSRRTFLRVGGLALGGLTLSDLLRGRANASSPRTTRDTAVIQLVLAGGPPHHETFDPKPDAPPEFRGSYQAISTNVSGIQLCELFPQLARHMDKYSILRSVYHNNGSHSPGRHWMLTGYPPIQPQRNDNERPATGAVAAKFRGANRPGVPAYVCTPNVRFGQAAYLGVGYNPFEVGDPNQKNFSVRNLRLPAGIDAGRVDDRRRLLATFDQLRRDVDTHKVLAGMDSFTREAFTMMTGQAAREAFDLEREAPQLRERYGTNTLGQSCLLARRLVEAGVTFVTIQDGGWDMHGNIKRAMDAKGPILDQALASLADDLAVRGLAERVMVIVLGEFGRTPKVNNNAGRDHWGNVFSVLIGGGGLRSGVAVGASNVKGEFPKDRPLRPEDVLATLYHVLGIDHHQTVLDNSGRPMHLLPGGTPIRELL
jgi:uncharacterized protein (DUF1501 family)